MAFRVIFAAFAAMVLFVGNPVKAATFDLGSSGGLTINADGTATDTVDGIEMTVTASGGKISQSNKGIGVDAPGDGDSWRYLDHDESLRFDFDPMVISVVAFVFEKGADGDGFYFKVGDVVSEYIEFGRDPEGDRQNDTFEFDLSNYFDEDELTFPISSFEIIGGKRGHTCHHGMWFCSSKHDSKDDAVKISQITVSAVPLPPAGILLLSAALGLGFMRRAKH